VVAERDRHRPVADGRDGRGQRQRVGAQFGRDRYAVIERERLHARVLTPGDEPAVPLLEHLPAVDRPAQTVERKPALVEIELRRGGRQGDVDAVEGVGEAADPVGPRVQQRDAGRPRGVRHARSFDLAQQLLALVAERVAGHPVGRRERRLESVGGEDYQCTPFIR
jgi:hypothetical protein